MTKTIELNENVSLFQTLIEKSTHLPLPLNSKLVSLLAESKTCGLAMLIGKLLNEGKGTPSPSYRHLISTLINRLHYNSIAITVSTENDPKKFVRETIDAASKISEINHQARHSTHLAANLLIQATHQFELDQIDARSLEYHWKEFVFHFYRYRLKSLT